MRLKLSVLGLLLMGAPAISAETKPPPGTLDCASGPVAKTFGGTPWLVYACSDNHSVVVMSAPGSKAAPFYFMFNWQNGTYRLVGEGTGNKAATDAAYTALHALAPAEIQELFSVARAAKH